MKDLKELRKEITEVDNEMAELFVRRMRLVSSVADYKMQNALPVLDPGREAQVLEMGAARVPDEELRSYYISFLKEVMTISRRYQRSKMKGLRVAYCGTEGAFAHIAACRLFPGAQKIPSEKPMRLWKKETATAAFCLLKTALPEMWIR